MAPGYRSVYLSARHLRSPELNVVKSDLEAAGIEVTSRWLAGTRAPQGVTDPNWLARISREDIERADAYVLLGDERGDSGHRHVEFGIAMGLNKPIFVVAPEWENLWQRLPTVTVVPDWDEARKVLIGG
jgi:hypothetical protein